MTKLQFERWKDFALRMARVCYATSRRPSSRWIVSRVRAYFRCIKDQWPSILSWDESSREGYCAGDLLSISMEDIPDRQYDAHWPDPVHCCVRAGLDVASEPNLGVIGFTVGHVRDMYPEGVPDWIANRDWVYKNESVPDLFAMAADTPLGL